MSNVSSEASACERDILWKKHSNLRLRAAAIDTIRHYFREQGFFEVQTPTIIKAPAPESHIEPVLLRSGEGLITSPELYMKRLLAAGYDKIFQICHAFRHGEQGRLHHPEFTLLEWYRINHDQTALQKDCLGLLKTVCHSVLHGPECSYRGNRLNVDAPWEHWTVSRAFMQYAQWDPIHQWNQDRFEEDLVQKVEPHLGFPAPAFLSDYPAQQAALARLNPDNPAVAERFELYWAGIELANGFSELVDAGEQRRRFEEVQKQRRDDGAPSFPLPEAFLASLDYLKPCAGIALGVDRLVMLLTNAETLDDVVTFPPEFQ